MNGLDLRSLEIFRTVAVEGSVTRAAEKLNRVQSNISTRVKQLEQQLDRTLFQRQNRGLTLTPDGQLLLSYAERLLRLSEEASNALNESEPRGVFRIGTMESTAAARLPAVLSRYHKRYPEVTVELETDTAGGLTERLLNYDIEAAFIAEPLAIETICTIPVFSENLILIAPATYPPLKDLEELRGKTIVAFEPGCAYRRYLEDWLTDSGIAPGGFMAMGSYLAILACVSAGAGFAVVPQSVLDTVSTKAKFRRYPLPDRMARIKTLLSWRADYRSAKLDALKDFLPEL